jgi:uncharacterized membrane protein
VKLIDPTPTPFCTDTIINQMMYTEQYTVAKGVYEPVYGRCMVIISGNLPGRILSRYIITFSYYNEVQ